jgi:DNA-binding transcriptional regulator YdaS (Cro superfamily)
MRDKAPRPPIEVKAAMAALDEAIAIAGSPAELARRLGVTRQAISVAKGKRQISREMAQNIQKHTGVSWAILSPHTYVDPGLVPARLSDGSES